MVGHLSYDVNSSNDPFVVVHLPVSLCPVVCASALHWSLATGAGGLHVYWNKVDLEPRGGDRVAPGVTQILRFSHLVLRRFTNLCWTFSCNRVLSKYGFKQGVALSCVDLNRWRNRLIGEENRNKFLSFGAHDFAAFVRKRDEIDDPMAGGFRVKVVWSGCHPCEILKKLALLKVKDEQREATTEREWRGHFRDAMTVVC